MTHKVIVFDLDDTLYAKSDPFLETVKQYTEKSYDAYQLYTDFLKYSEHYFNEYTSNVITLEQSYIKRMQKTLQTIDIHLSDSEALIFNTKYQLAQKAIGLKESFKDLLEFYSQQGIELAILTNGPTHTQIKKCECLKLEQFIPRKNWFVSDQIGYKKPDPRVFEYVCQQMNTQPNQMIMIGDTIQSDVAGAMLSGWHYIWTRPHSLKHNTSNPHVVYSISTLKNRLDDFINS
ncbi:HAD family hydrolase [Atopobacter phocae]|uniref:HAD family hydrolase n=1 Tax=Atopobacter phocae TaxID=136492 RepID=UPI000470EF79|nr:HAD family hydrolase [Atopobacter phocae]